MQDRQADRLRVPADAGPAAGTITARIDQVRIFELLEDRAIDAVYALETSRARRSSRSSSFAEHLDVGPEGLRRVRGDDTSELVAARPRHERGRCAQVRGPHQPRAGRARLLPDPASGSRRASSGVPSASSAFDPTLGTTLFELLVPNDFKTFAPDRRNLVLLLNPRGRGAAVGADARPLRPSGGAPWPWPAAWSGSCSTCGRDRVARAPAAPPSWSATPSVADPRFPSLRGAAEEAGRVARLLPRIGLRGRLPLVEDSAHPMAVLAALHEQPWRILHLAAHGVFEFDADAWRASRPPASCSTTASCSPAAEAEQMRYVPEVVFINCCHLGQTRRGHAPAMSFPDLAAEPRDAVHPHGGPRGSSRPAGPSTMAPRRRSPVCSTRRCSRGAGSARPSCGPASACSPRTAPPTRGAPTSATATRSSRCRRPRPGAPRRPFVSAAEVVAFCRAHEPGGPLGRRARARGEAPRSSKNVVSARCPRPGGDGRRPCAPRLGQAFA